MIFDEEDRELNLVLPLVIGVAVAVAIGILLFAALGFKGKSVSGNAAAASNAAISSAAISTTPSMSPTPSMSSSASIASAVPASIIAAATILPAQIYFASGNNRIDADGQRVIMESIEQLKSTTPAKIAIAGFVDATGSAAVNAELAKQRAVAVRDALQAAGIAGGRLVLSKPDQISAKSVDDRADRVVEVSVMP